MKSLLLLISMFFAVQSFAGDMVIRCTGKNIIVDASKLGKEVRMEVVLNNLVVYSGKASTFKSKEDLQFYVEENQMGLIINPQTLKGDFIFTNTNEKYVYYKVTCQK